MIQRFKTRGVWIRCLAAAAISMVYGIIVPPFLLHFIDGLSISSVLLLFAGILVFWWKEGFFTFFSWKKENGSLTAYREKVVEERKNTENPAFYAGAALFVISMFLTLLYYFL